MAESLIHLGDLMKLKVGYSPESSPSAVILSLQILERGRLWSVSEAVEVRREMGSGFLGRLLRG